MKLSRAGMVLVLLGGMTFGVGLAHSRMAEPEIVLSFLQLTDLGLLFVMGGAVAVTATTMFVATRYLDRAPLTGAIYATRKKSFDSNVLLGGGLFGVGWGLSGVCPGAAYASAGIGNYLILYAIGGMFVGAYVQGYARSYVAERGRAAMGAD